MPFLDPTRLHPLILPDGTPHRQMVQLSRVIDHPNISVGDFTYMNDFDPPQDWAAHIAPYLYPGAPERLVIGRFCQFAHGTRFITASANHPMTGLSTYPFAVFDHAQLEHFKGLLTGLPDTAIGNDVWIGHGALILPGARLGNGVIVGAGAVVRGAVPDYAIVAGNPARVLRRRFDAGTVERLNRLAWWDWPVDAVERAVPALAAADIEALELLAPGS